MSALEKQTSALQRDYVLIPAGLLVIGTAIVKRDWVIYSVIVAALFGVWNYFSLRTLSPAHCARTHAYMLTDHPRCHHCPEARRLPGVPS